MLVENIVWVVIELCCGEEYKYVFTGTIEECANFIINQYNPSNYCIKYCYNES